MADSSPHGSDIKLVTSEPETIRPGRPDLPRHVQAVTALRGTVGIVVCGPKEMTYDVRNAVAAEQLKIIAGAVACSECYLHTEAFGW
jgi:NAD(P)H-flavin reductase